VSISSTDIGFELGKHGWDSFLTLCNRFTPIYAEYTLLLRKITDYNFTEENYTANRSGPIFRICGGKDFAPNSADSKDLRREVCEITEIKVALSQRR
jgi:hypothetical protein